MRILKCLVVCLTGIIYTSVPFISSLHRVYQSQELFCPFCHHACPAPGVEVRIRNLGIGHITFVHAAGCAGEEG